MNSQKHWLEPQKAPTAQQKDQTRHERHRKPAWVLTLPLVLLLSAVALFGYAFRDRLLPGIPVETVRAIAMPAKGTADTTPTSAGSGQMLFQATGWLEPDPLPIRVTPLYSGVVREVLVLEGHSVTNGQPLVTLINDDARLRLQRAEAELKETIATFGTLDARHEVARRRLDTAQRLHESEQALQAELADTVHRLRALDSEIVPEEQLTHAELREKSQVAQVAAAASAIEERRAEIFLIETEKNRHQHMVRRAEVVRDEAALNLARTVVRSPVDGVVLRLLATPGKRLMLEMDEPDSATAVILFEPGKIQARIDVPLADAATLGIGQKVRVVCSLLPDQVFDAVVTRIVGEADVQRNTLQAKVRIANPDPRLRPEMLCRGEFLQTGNGSADSPNSVSAAALSIHVPIEAIVQRDGEAAGVWVVSPDGNHAEYRDVLPGSGTSHGDVTVLQGLRPGDRVIVRPPDSLRDGIRIRPRQTKP